jgi:hypothetical protein
VQVIKGSLPGQYFLSLQTFFYLQSKIKIQRYENPE